MNFFMWSSGEFHAGPRHFMGEFSQVTYILRVKITQNIYFDNKGQSIFI